MTLSGSAVQVKGAGGGFGTAWGFGTVCNPSSFALCQISISCPAGWQCRYPHASGKTARVDLAGKAQRAHSANRDEGRARVSTLARCADIANKIDEP
jgi:hypothetical protein